MLSVGMTNVVAPFKLAQCVLVRQVSYTESAAGRRGPLGLAPPWLETLE
jgi:hypothetical protein